MPKRWLYESSTTYCRRALGSFIGKSLALSTHSLEEFSSFTNFLVGPICNQQFTNLSPTFQQGHAH